MPENFPPQTWAEGATPTPDELRTWIRTFGPEHDARVAADMIVGMLEDTYIATTILRYLLDNIESRASRYRLAWQSARKRAKDWREDAEYWHDQH